MLIYRSDLNLAVELGKVVNSISILENGNVGIGTNNPSEYLSITGSNAGNKPSLGLRNGNSNTSFNNGAQIAFGYGGTNQYQHFIHTRHNSENADNSIDFYTCDGTLNNTITSGSIHTMSLVSGNVGIGTTSPSKKLDVYGNIRVGGPAQEHDIVFYNNGGEWQVGTNNSGNGTNNNQFYIYDSTYRLTVQKGTGNVGIGTMSPAEKLEVNGWIGRSAHNNGGLCGSYQTSGLGSNDTKTNPIYVIGTGYKPNENDLNNMYGIGYSHTNSFISSDSGSGWGMYVAADGDARIFLNGSTGSTSITGYYYGNGSQLTSLNANNLTNLSADKMGYGPNQNCKLHIGPAHWAGANQDAENVIQYEHEITFPGYRDNNTGGYRLASKITGFGISSPYYWDGYASGVNWRAMYAGGLSFYTCDSGWSGGDQTNKVLTLYKSNAYLKGSLYQNSDNMGTSDLRIKRDIIDINKNEILDKFLKINVKKYKYKDKKRKNKEVYGFIAQEIKEIIDDKGVSLDHNFIYDINEYGTIESNIITCECNLELNTQYRVIINDIKERDIIVKDNLENNKYRIDGYIHNYEEYNSDKIFIQGRDVNDFHYLNKNAIFTMNVNVTQELYKMIIDQNKLIKEKEEEIKKQNEILNNLIYRIELLENK